MEKDKKILPIEEKMMDFKNNEESQLSERNMAFDEVIKYIEELEVFNHTDSAVMLNLTRVKRFILYKKIGAVQK